VFGRLAKNSIAITALFCDLRGFTGFTESADAEDVMALLRDYHAAIGEIIIKYNGTLERYAPYDGFRVGFSLPDATIRSATCGGRKRLRRLIRSISPTWSATRCSSCWFSFSTSSVLARSSLSSRAFSMAMTAEWRSSLQFQSACP